MITEVGDYFEIDSGFDIFDPLGLKRLREAVDAFDNLRFAKNKKLDEQQKALERQGRMIRDISGKLGTITEENARKTKEIERLQSIIHEQNQQCILSEAAQSSSSRNLRKISEENTRLRSELCTLEQNYNELSDQYEKLIKYVRELQPDISLEDFYRSQK